MQQRHMSTDSPKFLFKQVQEAPVMTADHSVQKSEEVLASAEKEAEHTRIQLDTCKILAESLVGEPAPFALPWGAATIDCSSMY